ncbi:MAG: ABC transporter transmembrane domain-containing protein, partial [Victivallaceae bacterium]
MQSNQWSGVQVLQILFAQVRREVNFSALITEAVKEKYQQEPFAVLLKLASEHNLRPEKFTEQAQLLAYSGPALVQLKNENWVLLTDSRQLRQEASIALIDPTVGIQVLSVSREQLLEQLTWQGIIFRNLAQVDSAQQSRLTALVAIMRHHNVNADIREIMHEYAVGENEASELLFKQVASDYQFKCKKVSLNWTKLQQSRSIFPCVAVKKNGKYAVLCGLRKTAEDKMELVLADPESDNFNTPERFIFMSAEDFYRDYEGDFLLLKKIYKLSDEEQPFSLRWFIPEFLKNRAIFGEIAIMVGMLTIFSLIVPLFFQIVVDKVLVNQAYNTLNVIGVGILLAIIFNAVVNYIRNYLLLFATNKIDISTATKTFNHLMRLPVDFFERVPSGVLLKHMQQTEKIRGFLSGNLFFTILDVFSLAIFIPFLLFYSVTLTLIVLGFTLLMALVIACLIKPFQRRLDELYQAEGKRQSMLVESIHGVKTVKALALEPVEKRIWDDSTAYAIKSYFRVGKISMTAQSISQMLEMMMTVCVIWVGAHLVIEHTMMIGALIAFQMLASRVSAPLVKMVGLIHEYQQIALSVRML